MTRIIGYLKRVSNFSMPRQEEASRRFYANSRQFGDTNESQNQNLPPIERRMPQFDRNLQDAQILK